MKDIENTIRTKISKFVDIFQNKKHYGVVGLCVDIQCLVEELVEEEQKKIERKWEEISGMNIHSDMVCNLFSEYLKVNTKKVSSKTSLNPEPTLVLLKKIGVKIVNKKGTPLINSEVLVEMLKAENLNKKEEIMKDVCWKLLTSQICYDDAVAQLQDLDQLTNPPE